MKQTKKFLSLFLALTMLFSLLLTSCQTEEKKETQAPTLTVENTAEETKEETKEAAPQQNEFMPKRLKQAEVDAFALATENMTKEELRQLTLDFFLYQLSFQWVPNMNVTDWSVTYGSFKKALNTEATYAGIPYQSKGFGNAYRWLEYYDEETATFDVERAFAENGGYGEGGAIMDVEKDNNGNITYKKYYCFMTFFNQCSSNSFGGWARVINSADFYFTKDMNVYNGFIPVGGFTYPNMETLKEFGEKSETNPTGYDTDDVIRDWNAANGKDAMFKCYAVAKPADLLVSPGHTLMVKEVTVNKRSDGTINENTSTIVVQEQIEKWARSTRLNGKAHYVQGETDNTYTFTALQKAGYIPFTFAEYLDENDPIDQEHLKFYRDVIVPLHPIAKEYTHFTFTDEEVKAMSGEEVEEFKTFTTLAEGKTSVTLNEFQSLAVGSNYPISDCFVVVKDQDGKEVLKNVFRALNPRTREVSMTAKKSSQEMKEDGSYVSISEGLEAYADGNHTVEVSIQSYHGENPLLFTVTLNAN